MLRIQTLTPLVAVAVLALPGFVMAQYAERPSLVGSGEPGVDASGRSIKNPRVRAIHTTDPELDGGSADLIANDPFLAYQLGRNLCFREFRERDGVFGPKISNLAGPKLDETTAKITANNQTSCSGCHNLPYGTPGGGATFAKDSGRGRQTPHYFGSGIIEMLALQVRTEILLRVDRDGDGWISAKEASSSPRRLRVSTGVSRRKIDYGSARLSDRTHGTPMLNPIFRVWYGKKGESGIEIAPDATAIDGENATHYNFMMVVWGWGQMRPLSALNPTNRAFLWDPFVTHSGLDSHDPSTLADDDGDGVSEPTLAGAVQFPVTHRAPDPGDDTDELGFSRDDPDGDGYLTEISEGDLDLGEWFLLHTPRPAFAGSHFEYRAGVALLEKMNCTSCHVADWKIRATDPHFEGDRRLFDLDVEWNQHARRLEGKLVMLADESGAPRRAAFAVEGIFSDLAHHDMGQRLEEIGYDGNVNRIFRTAPLWGVGSGFPWGHDGASLTLEDVILRHGGEAERSRRRYEKSPEILKRTLLRFLGKLRLYDIESLPADIDGDGSISSSFEVADVDTGLERFNAEWLFRNPVAIQGMVENNQGDLIRSFAAVNLEEAYGLDLELRRDTDLDGWPDVWDHAPLTPGYKDGVND